MTLMCVVVVYMFCVLFEVVSAEEVSSCKVNFISLYYVLLV